MSHNRLRRLLLTGLILLPPAALFAAHRWTGLIPRMQTLTLEQALTQYGPAAEARLAPAFAAARLPYPPPQVTLLAFKAERRLELWAGEAGRERLIKEYPVQAASGGPGPKLREGDRQVPEGIYAVEYLNPNSRYHLSFKLDYPNPFDRAQAAREGRNRLGGDIMIHGKAVSIGCLAMGDEAIEELFTLVARTGRERVQVVIAPNDLRAEGLPPLDGQPAWVGELYQRLQAHLARYKR